MGNRKKVTKRGEVPIWPTYHHGLANYPTSGAMGVARVGAQGARLPQLKHIQ